MGDKKGCDDICLCRFELAFCLLRGHRTLSEGGFVAGLLLVSLLEVNCPKRKFMAASFPQSCCF